MAPFTPKESSYLEINVEAVGLLNISLMFLYLERGISGRPYMVYLTPRL